MEPKTKAVEVRDVSEVEVVGLEIWLVKHRRVKSEGWHPVSGLSAPVDSGAIAQGREYNKEVVC